MSADAPMMGRTPNVRAYNRYADPDLVPGRGARLRRRVRAREKDTWRREELQK